MKKLFVVFISFALVLSLVACGSSSDANGDSGNSANALSLKDGETIFDLPGFKAGMYYGDFPEDLVGYHDKDAQSIMGSPFTFEGMEVSPHFDYKDNDDKLITSSSFYITIPNEKQYNLVFDRLKEAYGDADSSDTNHYWRSGYVTCSFGAFESDSDYYSLYYWYNPSEWVD